MMNCNYPIEGSGQQTVLTVTNNTTTETAKKAHKKIEIPLKCSNDNNHNITQTCPADYPETLELMLHLLLHVLSIFDGYKKIYGFGRRMVLQERWWKELNQLPISDWLSLMERLMLRSTMSIGKKMRDIFTLWGILQLLRLYPGRVPDLELMFDCNDYPRIEKNHHWPFSTAAPPPLFRYCGDDKTWDIVFPDWSFWGWPGVNIRPWEFLSKDLKEGNKRVKFADREPYSYWKGNPNVAPHRRDLLKCNVSDTQDWNARLYKQLNLFCCYGHDWIGGNASRGWC